MKGLNWHGIIRFPCSVSLGIEFPSGRLLSEQEISLGLMTSVSWLNVRSREHIDCGVIVGRRIIGRSIEWLAVVLSWCMMMLNEHSRNGTNHSWRMHQIHGSGGLPRRRRSLVRALVCHLWVDRGEVSQSGQLMRRPRSFRSTLMPSGAEIVFSSRILLTLLPYCVLLPFGLALFAV